MLNIIRNKSVTETPRHKIGAVVFIALLLFTCVLSCKKEDANPLTGNWKVIAIYTKYTDPIYGLMEKSVDVDQRTEESGYFPGEFTHIRFYDRDSVVFITAIPFEIESPYLYLDPDIDEEIIMSNEYKGTYTIKGNTVSFKMQLGRVMGSSPLRYDLTGASMQLTVKDVDRWSEITNSQYIDKEVWILQRER